MTRSRREFLKHAARGAAAAAVAGGVALLALGGRADERCLLASRCERCGRRGQCALPGAVEYRSLKEHGQQAARGTSLSRGVYG
jgi:hypothetical protein